MNCVVIVPVYQAALDGFELASFRQGLRILRRHAICLVTFEGLDLSKYEKVAKECGKEYDVEYFERDFFSSVAGYNRLCLAKSFYERFLAFDYRGVL